MNKGLKTITSNNFSRALRNLDLFLSPYETELLVNSLETEKHHILSLKNSKNLEHKMIVFFFYYEKTFGSMYFFNFTLLF